MILTLISSLKAYFVCQKFTFSKPLKNIGDRERMAIVYTVIA